MKKWNSHTLLVSGYQVNNDGSPSTRALAGKLNQLTSQMDELADDIELIKRRLSEISAMLQDTNHFLHVMDRPVRHTGGVVSSRK